jgi:deazaflavin-dependent oxidoreductase (nitroreductase family)
MHRLSVRFGPIARPLAGSRWFPLYAALSHVGRRSGRAYETPVVARPTPDGFLIPLPFGLSTQWAQNLIAARGGHLRQGGRSFAIDRPEIIEREVAEPLLSRVIRAASRRAGIRYYVRVRLAADDLR